MSDSSGTPKFRMPTSRAKSCNQCRAAKTRCSLSSPCSRCAKRCLECHYFPTRNNGSNFQRWRKDFRPILPLTDALSGVERITNNGGPHTDYSSFIAETSDAILPVVSATAAQISYSSSDTTPEENSTTDMVTWVDINTEILDLATYQSDAPSLFDIPVTSTLPHGINPGLRSLGASGNGSVYPRLVDSSPTLSPLNLNYPMASFGLGVNASPMLSCIDFGSSEPLTSAVNSARTVGKSYLAARERSFKQGSLTGKMIMSQLIDYTRRIADGKHLPPFIHPPCFLSQNDECPPDTPHTCLPKPLAICKNLTQLFYSCTPGSSGFVWEQIYTHLRQMHAEYKTYDKQSLLQALQAAIIYGLLCSQCTEFVAGEDKAWLISTAEVFSRRLFDISSDCLDIDYVCSSRSKWIFAESTRRVGCILYLIDLLFHINGQTPSTGRCPEFVNLSLPCTRELWRPISDRDWRKLYNEETRSKKMKGSQDLTVGNLFYMRQSLLSGEDLSDTDQADLAKELSNWVERVDDLSMLLWLALTLEGDGQAQMIQRTLNMA